jgi:redox-sensitive bicupin YhaK (pirin superfamily)
VHEEVPVENGKIAHGMQMFINLAAADELQAGAICTQQPRALVASD